MQGRGGSHSCRGSMPLREDKTAPVRPGRWGWRSILRGRLRSGSSRRSHRDPEEQNGPGHPAVSAVLRWRVSAPSLLPPFAPEASVESIHFGGWPCDPPPQGMFNKHDCDTIENSCKGGGGFPPSASGFAVVYN